MKRLLDAIDWGCVGTLVTVLLCLLLVKAIVWAWHLL